MAALTSVVTSSYQTKRPCELTTPSVSVLVSSSLVRTSFGRALSSAEVGADCSTDPVSDNHRRCHACRAAYSSSENQQLAPNPLLRDVPAIVREVPVIDMVPK